MYRREAISSWKSGKYVASIGALHSLLGLLPSTYRLTISSEEYDNITKQNLIAICQQCNSENNYSLTRKDKLILQSISGFISGEQTEQVWTCNECSKYNQVTKTKFIQKVIKQPCFIKVIPDPPARKDGMLGRTQFHIKFSNWFWLALSSIEAQMGRYREEYQPKDADMFDIETEIQDGGESLE